MSLRFLVVGPVGAGISSALSVFAEFGYAVVQQCPVEQLAQAPDLQQDTVLSVKLDPQKTSIEQAQKEITALKQVNPDLKVLYLSAPTEVLLKRYVDTGRFHPYLKPNADLRSLIEQEQLMYQALRPLAEYHIDTSAITPVELRYKIAKVLGIAVEKQPTAIEVVSFGFKRGMPTDADLVFDVRFLPNPFYDEALRPYTGKDKPVQDYVFSHDVSKNFLNDLQAMLKNVVPAYQNEGKTRLKIAIGCTGGQHRSVAITEKITERLQADFENNKVQAFHREMPHWAKYTEAKKEEPIISNQK